MGDRERLPGMGRRRDAHIREHGKFHPYFRTRFRRGRRYRIQFIVLLLIGVVVVWLLRILVKEGGARRRKAPGKRPAAVSETEERLPGRPCPLCQTPLERGQRVHSVVYPGKTDKLVEIYGCPNCRPKTGPTKAARVCPVCRQTLADTDYVVGRMFQRSNKRKHLHVLGCTRCRKGA
jgi:uncharacterized protein YbaR (Trm112 family)